MIRELKFNEAMPGISAVQTLRGLAVKGDAYSQWNLCDYTGDDALRVLDARLAFCQHMGITLDQLIMPRQTHSSNVKVIDQNYLEADIDAQEAELEGVDALVTALSGVCIGVNTADCVPIALADVEHGVVAIVHAGWRGTVARIAKAAIEAMKRLGAATDAVHATMGASICEDCFEVGDEVPQAFADADFNVDEIMHRNVVTGKAHISLQRANRQVLVEAGVNVKNIVLPEACSRCDSERYFSARRLGINSGRSFTAIIQR